MAEQTLRTAEEMEAYSRACDEAADRVLGFCRPIGSPVSEQSLQDLRADIVATSQRTRRDNWLIAAEQCRRDEHLIEAMQALADVFRKGTKK